MVKYHYAMSTIEVFQYLAMLPFAVAGLLIILSIICAVILFVQGCSEHLVARLKTAQPFEYKHEFRNFTKGDLWAVRRDPYVSNVSVSVVNEDGTVTGTMIRRIDPLR
jgi:hypothetical protein